MLGSQICIPYAVVKERLRNFARPIIILNYRFLVNPLRKIFLSPWFSPLLRHSGGVPVSPFRQPMPRILNALADNPERDSRESEGERLMSEEKGRASYDLPRQCNLDTLSSFML